MGITSREPGTVRGTAKRPHFSLAFISVTVQLWTLVFWVISVYFNIRNTVPKFGTFLLGHPVHYRLAMHGNSNIKYNSKLYSKLFSYLYGSKMKRRRKKLLDDLKDRRGYSHLEEALNRTMWRHRFGGGFGPVFRQNTEWMNECIQVSTNVQSLRQISCVAQFSYTLKIQQEIIDPNLNWAHRFVYM